MLSYPQDVLLTDRLFMRKIDQSDLAALYPVHSVDAVNRFLPYETWQSFEDAEKWWQRTSERMDSGTGIQFVIGLRQNGELIGSCTLFAYDEPARRAEVGYVLGQAYWGRKLGGEAVHGLLDFAFSRLALRRIEARVDTRNVASARLLQRLGFSSEGCLRQWQQDCDLQLFGLLREEWP
ncbi:GNAT family N-acetyltransferase [Pseudohalioglobus sediminis]|nr:GNAT family N-acetyltransferase [Pseudohalioglobus sediminis]